MGRSVNRPSKSLAKGLSFRSFDTELPWLYPTVWSTALKALADALHPKCAGGAALGCARIETPTVLACLWLEVQNTPPRYAELFSTTGLCAVLRVAHIIIVARKTQNRVHQYDDGTYAQIADGVNNPVLGPYRMRLRRYELLNRLIPPITWY
jgi:hypothetical protein